MEYLFGWNEWHVVANSRCRNLHIWWVQVNLDHKSMKSISQRVQEFDNAQCKGQAAYVYGLAINLTYGLGRNLIIEECCISFFKRVSSGFSA